MNQYVYIVCISMLLFVHVIMMRNKRIRDRGVGTYSAAFLMMILYFEIVPIIYFVLPTDNMNDPQKMVHDSTVQQFVFAEIVIIVFTIIFNFTYRKYNNYSRQLSYQFSEEKLDKLLKVIVVITFVVGGTAMLIYINAFGGVLSLLEKANYLRSFSTDATEFVSYYISLLVIPARLITVTPIMVVPLLKKSKKKTGYIFIFVISFMLAIIFLLSNAGKANIIVFFLCFALPFLEKRFKHPWRLTIICSAFALPLLDVLDEIFVFLQKGTMQLSSIDILKSLRGFTYPYNNLLNLLQISEQYDLRYGTDFITGVLNLLPGISFDPTYIITSEYFGGANWKVGGGTPVDIVTFGFLQFHIVGVVIIAIIVGVIFGKMDRILAQIPRNSYYYILVVSVIVSSFTFLTSADVSSVLMSQFQFILSVFCILYSTKKQKDSHGGIK